MARTSPAHQVPVYAASRWSRRELLRTAAGLTLAAGGAGVAAAAYALAFEPRWIEVVPVRVRMPRLAPAFSGYRIVQISDLHLGDGLSRDQLAGVVRLVNQQRADLIAVTGDFITRGAPLFAHDLITTLRGLAAHDGVVAVLGNHDHWSSAATIRAVIAESGMRDLDNAVHTLERGGALLHIAGVDDMWEQQARLDDVLARLPRAGAAVLLAHEPDFADVSATCGRFDLQLSGHSHGGQVVVPFYGPPQLPPYARHYPLGRYRVGRMVQYTNRGIGTLWPHVRVNCRPEITVFTLEAPQEGAS
jgi:predicted MPP superfamily phosphohydrolase